MKEYQVVFAIEAQQSPATRNNRILAVALLLSIGCRSNTGGDGTNRLITHGIEYAEAKSILTTAGFAENTATWAMEYPEDETLFTYYVDIETALLVFVSGPTGRIRSLLRYEHVDRPQVERDLIPLQHATVDKGTIETVAKAPAEVPATSAAESKSQ